MRASDAGIVVITEIRPISVLFTLPQQQLSAVNAALANGALPVDAFDTERQDVLDRGTLQVVDNQVDQTTGTVRMKADFPNANLQLWPGQFVNVRVLIDTLKQVVVVPTPAVQRGPAAPSPTSCRATTVLPCAPITVQQQTDTRPSSPAASSRQSGSSPPASPGSRTAAEVAVSTGDGSAAEPTAAMPPPSTR